MFNKKHLKRKVMKAYKIYELKRSDLKWWSMCFNDMNEALSVKKRKEKSEGSKGILFTINII